MPPETTQTHRTVRRRGSEDAIKQKRGFASLFPAGQFVRYLCVGAFNTFFRLLHLRDSALAAQPR